MLHILSGCPMIWQSYTNDHSAVICAQMNNACYGGRKVFEWHNNGTLWVYPENRFDTIITFQPIGVGAYPVSAQATYVTEPAVYVAPEVVVAKATTVNSVDNGVGMQPATVVTNPMAPPTYSGAASTTTRSTAADIESGDSS